MRQYGGNRVGLAVFGGVLLALGGYAWLRGTELSPKARILPDRTVEAVAAHSWAVWAAALLLVVLTLVTLRWLVLALGWGRYGQQTGTGSAMLCVGLKDVEGVTKSSVRVVGDSERLRIALTCRESTDVGAVAGRLDRDLVGKIRREVSDNDLGTVVRLHVRG
ncbi:hypothetical protein [Nonomuraea sp. NPDC050310]|uniref:hypothetical protein n=1 Tax=unclassified Nonomuraea TaxID=2593643 RepID=UPI0033F796B2